MNLSPEQKRVAQLVLDGNSFAQIAKELGVSNIAVGNRLHAIRKRTGCFDRYDFFIYADKLGLTRPSEGVLLIGESLFRELGPRQEAPVAPCNTKDRQECFELQAEPHSKTNNPHEKL